MAAEKMSDEVTIKLIKYIEDNQEILKSPNRNRKQQLKEELKIHLGNVYSLDAIEKKIHSLRTTMRRIVKKETEPTDSSDSTKDKKSQKTWKFYNALQFLKTEIEEDLEKEKSNLENEMSDDEKVTLVEFYKNSPQLWDPSLKEYRDRDQRRASLQKLSIELENKYSVKQLTDTWHKMSTYYQRENVKQESSKTSGTGKDDVYVSVWPFFKSMEFLNDKTEPDMGISTTFDQTLPPQEKKTPSKRKKEEEKENAMEMTKMKVLEALVSKLTDNKSSTSSASDMSWKSAYEEGFQAGFQAGFQQCLAVSQLQFQPAQPKPTNQFFYNQQAQFSSTPTSCISQSTHQILQTQNNSQDTDWGY